VTAAGGASGGAFAKISLTAKLAAYMRQFSDVPFAADVAHLLRAEEAFDALLADQGIGPTDLLWYAPVFEVRYKSVARAIAAARVTQVLELASGLSLRGLAMTRDPALTYVESDLEELTDDKIALVAEIQRRHQLPSHGNLHLVAANALDRDQLRTAAARLLRGQPVAVVNEGLLQYLTAAEMETVARNVRELLVERGGVWITPDFSVKDDVRDISDRQQRFRAAVAAATERRMYDNAFADAAALQAFFDRVGFAARVVNQVDEAGEVVSMKALQLPPETLERLRPRLKLWILAAA
jgi:O-methyltransferase involved in polyketide biosynthesis